MNTILSVSSVISNFSASFETFLLSIGLLGGIISCLLIVVESMVPVLPLCVFITLNFYVFGHLVGFIISWIFTLIGCSLSFFICRSCFREKFNKRFMKEESSNFAKKLMLRIDKMSVSSLAMIVAIPFTPAFLVNIIASQSKMTYKKFITSLLIGKVFMVYFWGYIGTTLIESLTNPAALIKIAAMILIAYVISKVANKYFKID